jgi:hypothetical protein
MSDAEELIRKLKVILETMGIEATVSESSSALKLHVESEYGQALIPVCWISDKNGSLIGHAARRLRPPDRRPLSS